MDKRIVLVTCKAYPNLTESDGVLARVLQDAGGHPVAVDWRDRDIDWSSFDIAVARSTWDYHHHPDEFSRWIDAVAEATCLVNPAPIMQWNRNKRYLIELTGRGIPVLPFTAVMPGEPIPFRQLDQFDGDEIVIKPWVGASAWQIVRTKQSELGHVVTPELRRDGFMIQQYAPEIADGEYSVVFFDGRFSHAVLKKPRTGDFRTQPELGATQSLVVPTATILSGAEAVLKVLPQRPHYARIDGILQSGRFVLMEAELIEPELYFHIAPNAAAEMAALILSL